MNATQSRPLPAGLRRRLLDQFCRRQASYLWAQKRIITPVLVHARWGDGLQAVQLRPIITRTWHYVVGRRGEAGHRRVLRHLRLRRMLRERKTLAAYLQAAADRLLVWWI